MLVVPVGVGECTVVMSEEPKHLVPVSQFSSPSVRLVRDGGFFQPSNDVQPGKNVWKNYGNYLNNV